MTREQGGRLLDLIVEARSTARAAAVAGPGSKQEKADREAFNNLLVYAETLVRSDS